MTRVSRATTVGSSCDAPAQTVIKDIEFHSGYLAREICTQQGKWKRRMMYLEIDSILQTYKRFF